VRLRDDFLSIAGHELRTPLTALQLQLQGLVRNARKPSPPPVADLVDRLEKASGHVARLERLINELLDVSRITTGRMGMHREEIDLAALAREVIERFADDSERAHAPVALSAPAPVVGHWDRLRIDQVLTNLVANAIKYGAGQAIDVEVAREDGRAVVRVRDHGIGIGPAAQERIFGRFERAVSERHFGGLGLGLWIARQIVEAHGGAITVRSTPGRETLFTVELP
jgi:two-component system OmpR family sensor kinase